MRRKRTTISSIQSRGIRPIYALLIAWAFSAIVEGADAQPRPDKAIPPLRALDPRWQITFPVDPAAPAGFDDSTAYVPLKGDAIVAIDLDRGDTRWQIPWTTTLMPATGDGLIFVAGDGVIEAFEGRTGASVWRTPIARLARPPYWDAGWLLISTDAGDLIAIRSEDGTVTWRRALGSPIVAAPAPAEDRLYVALADHRVAAVALESGAPIWSRELGDQITGVLALNDQVIVSTRDNLIHSLEADRGRFKWHWRVGADPVGTAAADAERIYFVALDNVVRAVDRGSGNLEWTRPLSARPATGPLRLADVVLVPLLSGEIAAFAAATGAPAFSLRVSGDPGGVPFVRETVRPTVPRLIALTRDGKLASFAARFEPAPALLQELPGVKVSGGY